MTYEANEQLSEFSEMESLLYMARAGSSVLRFKPDEEKKLEEKLKEADRARSKKFEESLKASGKDLESVKKNIKESLDPLREIEGLSPLLRISEEKGGILSHALKVVCEKLHAQIGAIFLIDKDGLLKRVSIFGIDKNGKQIESDWYEEEAYPVDAKSFVGRAAIPEELTGYGRFQFTPNLKDENNLDQNSKHRYFEKCDSLGRAIAVPINGRNRTYGVLRIINTIDPQTKEIVEDADFKEIDVVWLSLLATYIASALSNFRRDLQTKILEHLNYQLANPASSTNNYYEETLDYYQGILDLLVMNSETAFKAGVLRLIDDDTQTLKVVATSIFSADVERDNNPIKIGEGLAGSVAESRQRLILPDISKEQFHNERWVSKNSFRTFSCFPLISRGSVVGTLSLYTGYKYDYHKDSINFLQSVAESIATYTLLEFSGNKIRLRGLFETYESKQKLQKKSSFLKDQDVEKQIIQSLINKPYELDRGTINDNALNSHLLPGDLTLQRSSKGKLSTEKKQNLYRFALPKRATREQRQHFKRSIQEFQNMNPEWNIFQDWTQPGEDQAFVCIKKDDSNLYYYSAYVVVTALSKVFQNLYCGQRV